MPLAVDDGHRGDLVLVAPPDGLLEGGLWTYGHRRFRHDLADEHLSHLLSHDAVYGQVLGGVPARPEPTTRELCPREPQVEVALAGRPCAWFPDVGDVLELVS